MAPPALPLLKQPKQKPKQHIKSTPPKIAFKDPTASPSTFPTATSTQTSKHLHEPPITATKTAPKHPTVTPSTSPYPTTAKTAPNIQAPSPTTNNSHQNSTKHPGNQWLRSIQRKQHPNTSSDRNSTPLLHLSKALSLCLQGFHTKNPETQCLQCQPIKNVSINLAWSNNIDIFSAMGRANADKFRHEISFLVLNIPFIALATSWFLWHLRWQDSLAPAKLWRSGVVCPTSF